MRRPTAGLVTVISATLAVISPALAATDDAMLGFSPPAADQQRRLEAKFDAALNKDDIRQWIKEMSSEPNQTGSPHNKANAERMLEMFESWGFDAHIETYQVLFPTPKVRELELVAPTQYEAKLREPPVDGDSTSDITQHALPPYNAYSADGDVTAELVYVNYGLPEDYEELARRGISVEGKVVIARYGHSWRGIKPRVAYEHGAVGCIMYSDPIDDGFGQGDIYPKGGWRNRWSVQRGSVTNMTLYAGDALTPGYASIPGAERLSLEEAPQIKEIPVLPISYGDALPLLEALEGPVAPQSWRGALPITYHIGPGPAKVHLKVAFNWDQVPAYNVVAKIPGSVYPDQWVLRGNHHDAWVFGAEDPLSGNAAMLAEAKAIGTLLEFDWKPERTIVYLSWDAEELGLIGSTEWAEDHAEQLATNAAIYINSDNNSRGFLSAGGSGSLQAFLNQVGRGVEDPETGTNVIQRARAHGLVEQLEEPPEQAAEKISPDPDAPLPLAALGSGSDYGPFLDHLGIASLDIRFQGEGDGTQYHSRYDSFDWYRRYADPTFEYGVALAKVGGHGVLRFANADILPYTFTPFAQYVSDYAEDIEKQLGEMREQTEKKNALIQAEAFKLASDPTRQYVPPEPQPPVPQLEFEPLEQAITRLKEVSKAYDTALQAYEGGLSQEALEKLNEVLISTERQLLYEGGLPHREWFRHMIYAPGFYTGYGVKTLPGIREAVENREWDTAKEYIAIVAGALNDFSDQVETATGLLKGST